ncbi:mechanosensitive ion channel family protein [Novosphingobium sp. ZN18A2]|uniref:mechanosensitive ion channel family protein n=1 Tax=Novosphingobium sp. ZN18A2 TaxID=3079861 RepID=UPI0030D3E8E3
MRVLCAVLCALGAACLTLAPPALAQASLIPAPSPAATETPAPAPAISATSAAEDDAQIAARLRGIYAAISDLSDVKVSVSSGVVTLTGEVPSAEAIGQAGSIAQRLAGVVTVQNRLTRNLAVERNLDPALSGVSSRAQQVVQALPLIGVAALVALIVGALGYFIAARDGLWRRLAPNPFLAELVASAIRFVFVVGGIVLALDILGASALIGAVLGGAGVVGIAIGFAVKDTIDNYVSSLMLSLRQPFRANDHVLIDTYEGRVIRLTSRATVLMTLDGNHLRIPNSTVFKAVILNFTTNPQRRFDFSYPIDHGVEPQAARALALQAIKSLDFVLDDPEPLVLVDSMTGPTMVLEAFGWIDQTATDFYKARTRALQAVRAALRDAGIVFPDTSYRVVLDREAQAPQPVAEPAAPAREEAEAQDVAPEDHIAGLVERERAGQEGGRDLLDPSRPVE